ncbi:O-methyltransferase [Actinoplanes sp. NPDC051633]|uniref:O-methyltransferase n=1 Tax=Actinoplanes sp. NPDC051633 TaxID=3155670 RepID=UPI0034277189
MTYKPLNLTPELHEYLLAHSTPPDPIIADLIAETRQNLPEAAGMQVAPEQAAFLKMLATVTGAKRAVEIGTFTGLSALAIARGLGADGRLNCYDISTEFTDIARRYWARAGVDDRIELRIGPAADSIRDLPEDEHLDLVFIDADKENYTNYWNALLPRVRKGGLVLVDNVLWSGRVLDPQNDRDRGVADFNAAAVGDPRVELVIVPIGDGITMARKK